MPDQDMTQTPGRRARDRAMAILLVGIALLMPPVAQVFLVDDHILGLPIPVLYIFVVWGALILGAMMISGPLKKSEARGPGAGSGGNGAPDPQERPPGD